MDKVKETYSLFFNKTLYDNNAYIEANTGDLYMCGIKSLATAIKQLKEVCGIPQGHGVTLYFDGRDYLSVYKVTETTTTTFEEIITDAKELPRSKNQ